MIKKYNQYIKEEFNWRNLNPFKKNKYYPEYTGNELDPYGEEEWDDDNLTPVLQISKQQNKPYEQITRLNCSYQNLTNLDGIENLINLKSLYCNGNYLINLNGIENLINLEYLSCSFNRLTSLNGIENLVNLKDLYCLNNNFSNEYKKYIKEYCQKKKICIDISIL